MKPYLEPNNTIAFLVEWVGFVVLMALVLAPFFFIRKYRPNVRWRHVIFAYVSSFVVFGLSWWIMILVDEWIKTTWVNYGWLVSASNHATSVSSALMILLWPLLIFYVVKTKYGSYTKKRAFLATSVFLLFLFILAGVTAYGIAWGLGTIGMKYL